MDKSCGFIHAEIIAEPLCLMRKQLKNRIKIILIEIVGLSLFVNGIAELYRAYRSDAYEALILRDYEKLKWFGFDTVNSFFAEQGKWKLIALILGGLILVAVKIMTKNKGGIIDSLISSLMVFLLFILGLLMSNIFIGILLILIGIGIVWFLNFKKHKTQQWL